MACTGSNEEIHYRAIFLYIQNSNRKMQKSQWPRVHFYITVYGVCLHVDHSDKVISARNLQLPSAPFLPRGSCSQPIFYVRNIILPNSSSHTGQGKSEPDAIQPLPKRTAAKARTRRHVFLQKGWQTVLANAATFENSITCEFSICNRQKWTQLL